MCHFKNTKGGNKNGEGIVVKLFHASGFFVYIKDIYDSNNVLLCIPNIAVQAKNDSQRTISL
jgi:hypothetical protein